MQPFAMLEPPCGVFADVLMDQSGWIVSCRLADEAPYPFMPDGHTVERMDLGDMLNRMDAQRQMLTLEGAAH